jgi:hypothetical protein
MFLDVEDCPTSAMATPVEMVPTAWRVVDVALYRSRVTAPPKWKTMTIAITSR